MEEFKVPDEEKPIRGGRKAKAEEPPEETTYRDKLLGAMSALKAIRLNVSKAPMFKIPRSVGERSTDYVFSVSRRSPVVIFGKEGQPTLASLPTHALETLYRGLQDTSLIDVSKDPTILPSQPLTQGSQSRVPEGKDPVLASGLQVEQLTRLLKAPEAEQSKDPDGDVIDRIRKGYENNFQVLVGLQHQEQCSQARGRVLGALEDMIQDAQDKKLLK